MRKEIYLLKGTHGESYEHFSKRLISLAKSVSGKNKEALTKLTVTVKAPPALSIIPFKKNKIAAFSILKPNDELIDELTHEPGFSGVYFVDEAIPVGYTKHWNDLDHTPGICLLTLFKKKRNLDYETFLDRWHNSHTPLSLRIHPLWNYNRNVVKSTLAENSEDWHGIVEEQFKTTAHLLNPIKFFGYPPLMFYHMWQVYSDTKSFLDYKTIEPYFATEIHIKS